MSDKISLAGDLGSGKSTVSDILVEVLGAEYYSTGRIVRSIAEKMGMTVVELNHYMESHPEIDNEIDDGLVRLSDDERLLIIDSRMAWHFTKGTFKVYLSTDIETSALRIMGANRQGEHNSTLEDTIASTRARRLSEQKRYMEQYGVDIKNLMNYSLVVDTTVATPEEVAGVIISAYREWQKNKERRFLYVSPERLNIFDDEPNADKLSEYTDLLDRGETIPTVKVCERDGDFYLREGLEEALAYTLGMYTFIPAELVEYGGDDREFVRIKNSL